MVYEIKLKTTGIKLLERIRQLCTKLKMKLGTNVSGQLVLPHTVARVIENSLLQECAL